MSLSVPCQAGGQLVEQATDPPEVFSVYLSLSFFSSNVLFQEGLNRTYCELAQSVYHATLAASLQNKRRTHGDLQVRVVLICIIQTEEDVTTDWPSSFVTFAPTKCTTLLT